MAFRLHALAAARGTQHLMDVTETLGGTACFQLHFAWIANDFGIQFRELIEMS